VRLGLLGYFHLLELVSTLQTVRLESHFTELLLLTAAAVCGKEKRSEKWQHEEEEQQM